MRLLVAAGFIQTREVLRGLGEVLQDSAARGPHGSFGHISPEHFCRLHRLAPGHSPPGQSHQPSSPVHPPARQHPP